MPSIVNTNMLSYTTQRQMNKAQAAQQNAMTRLSSGLRINGAKDDAAGLSIANRMSSQITGLNQAARNANDGISLAQTAEGGLNEINTNLQRLRELAVQSSSATNTASDRAALQQETKQLLSEINRVATDTDFNGIKLLDGSFQDKAFQIGANAGQTTKVSIASANITELGSSATSAVTGRGGNTGDGTASAMALGDVIVNGVSVGASVATSDDKSFSMRSASAIAKAAAFNAVSSSSGVTATVNANEVEGAKMTNAAGTTGAGYIYINGLRSETQVNVSDSGAATRTSVMKAINDMAGRTGVMAVDGGTDNAGIKLVAADGRNISVGVDGTLASGNTGLNVNNTPMTAADDAADAGYKTFTGSITLSSEKNMKIERGTGDVNNAGLREGSFEAQKAAISSRELPSGIGGASGKEFTAGDFKINGVLIGDSLSGNYDKSSTPISVNGVNVTSKSAISKAGAINAISNLTGVTATANTTILTGTSVTGAGNVTGTLNINGFQTAAITTSASSAAETRQAVAQAINDIAGRTGVRAIDTNDPNKGIRLEAADGRNIAVFGTGLTAADTGVDFVGTDQATGTIQTGSVTLTSTKSFSIDSGTTGNDVTTTLGLEAGTYGGGRTGQSLASIDISTAEGAASAITAIDNALSSVDNSRVNMGAIQNRFTSTVSALQSTASNLTAARSRIQDADFAAESAEMSRAGILQQAGTAMLAQANASSQGVLSLLR